MPDSSTPRLHVGTSGYSYKEWKGSFYPEKLAASKMLAHYGERLSAVELNNTFYRLPKRTTLESWAEQVPEGFRFAVKASRRITHFARLKEADEVTEFFLTNTEVLGEKRGVLFFQLPPNLKCDLGRFDAFLALLPEGTPAAFEFRHESWVDEAVHQRLADRRFALVANDSEDAPAELVATADWGYLRLRRPDYDASALARWADRIREQPWHETYVFFKHEESAPRLALEFRALAEFTPKKRRPAAAASAETG